MPKSSKGSLLLEQIRITHRIYICKFCEELFVRIKVKRATFLSCEECKKFHNSWKGRKKNLMTLNKLAADSHTNAMSKGFYSELDELLAHESLTKKQKDFIRKMWLGNRLMLIVSELAEGLEGIRKNNYSSEPKSGGLCEEIADAQIRLADFAVDIAMVEDPGFNLEETVKAKAFFNSTREKMHGKTS